MQFVKSTRLRFLVQKGLCIKKIVKKRVIDKIIVIYKKINWPENDILEHIAKASSDDSDEPTHTKYGCR